MLQGTVIEAMLIIAFGKEGGSEIRDTSTGGAGYVFARLKEKSKISSVGLGLVWKSKRHVKRLDAMSFESDFFGSQRFSTSAGASKKFHNLEDWDLSLQERAVDLKSFKQHATGRGNNEIIFKDGLSVFEDLEFFVVRPNEKNDVINFLREKGYKKWPDGRKLEEVVVTENDIRDLKLAEAKAVKVTGTTNPIDPVPDDLYDIDIDLIDIDLDDD